MLPSVPKLVNPWFSKNSWLTEAEARTMSSDQRKVTLELFEILKIHSVPQMDIFLVSAAEALRVILVEGYGVDGHRVILQIVADQFGLLNVVEGYQSIS